MERRLQKIIFFSFLLQIFLFSTAAQEVPQDKKISIQLWAELDSFPENSELTEAQKNVTAEDFQNKTDTAKKAVFGYAIDRLTEISPFIMEGMLYGWTFDYTPSDKARQVSEYFDYQPVQAFDSSVNPLNFRQTQANGSRLESWVETERIPAQQKLYLNWKTINNPRIHGKGSAEISLGMEGIKKAVGEALKNGIREYWRTYIKNKPKAIEGKILLINQPRIYIKDGRYTADLDFFMETDRIITYSSF